MEKRIKKLRLLWFLAHQCNISPDELHRYISEVYPETNHLSLLNEDQLNQLIKWLREKKRRQVVWSPFHTEAQERLAYTLAHEILLKKNQNTDPNAQHLLDALSRRFGAESYEYTNTRQAAWVIEALKAMKKRLTP